MKSYLLYWIEQFMLRGYSFCNISQLIIKTISDSCNRTYEHFLTQPMHMCDKNLNKKVSKSRQLISSLDRSKMHPQMRTVCHIPFYE